VNIQVDIVHPALCAAQDATTEGVDANDPPLRRIAVIDRMAMTRECLRFMLQSNVRDCRIEAVPVPAMLSRVRPDVVLLNIQSVPIEADQVRDDIAEIRRIHEDALIIVIADNDDSHSAREAMRLKLRGYVPTSQGTEIVVAALRLVLVGGTFVPDVLIAEYTAKTTALPTATPMLASPAVLTEREQEVLDRLRPGMQNKNIAFDLNISESTVKVHIRNIMKKLKATNRTQVAFLAQTRLPSPQATDAITIGPEWECGIRHASGQISLP
jgi:DNA-binding NarL/FixJ family response regulator